MANRDDNYYIGEVKQGNAGAFAFLVDRYKSRVYTLALKMIKNREEAEEAAQDTFVKVYRSLSAFKGESKFSTWVYKVTYNTCLDHLKKYKKEKNIIPVDEFKAVQLIETETIVDTIGAADRSRIIQDCICLLPGDDAFLVTLYYLEEQSLEEIANVIGITANNVKIRLFRSRKKLAVILEKKLEPEIKEYYGK